MYNGFFALRKPDFISKTAIAALLFLFSREGDSAILPQCAGLKIVKIPMKKLYKPFSTSSLKV